MPKVLSHLMGLTGPLGGGQRYNIGFFFSQKVRGRGQNKHEEAYRDEAGL